MRKISVWFLMLAVCTAQMPYQTNVARAGEVSVSEYPEYAAGSMAEVSEGGNGLPVETILEDEAAGSGEAILEDEAAGSGEVILEDEAAGSGGAILEDEAAGSGETILEDEAEPSGQIVREEEAAFDEEVVLSENAISGNEAISQEETQLPRAGETDGVQGQGSVSENDVSGVEEQAVAPPSAPLLLSAAADTYQSVRLTYGAVTGAAGYEIYRGERPDGSDMALLAVIESGEQTDYTDQAGLKTGTTYYYKVRAYVPGTAQEKVYGDFSAILLATPSLKQVQGVTVVSKTYQSIALTWNRTDGADGYEIFRSKKSSTGFKKLTDIKKGTTLTYTDKKCSLGVTYYYKVRAYRNVSGKKVYSDDSKVKKCKTTLARPKQKKAALLSVDTAKISWNKVNGAKGYEVYRSRTKNGKYKRVSIVKGTSCEISDRKTAIPITIRCVPIIQKAAKSSTPLIPM